MKNLMYFLVSNFNSVRVSSTNLNTGFEYFSIQCENHVSQRIEINISIDDNFWQLRIYSLSSITYEKDFENPHDLIERLKSFIGSREFSRGH